MPQQSFQLYTGVSHRSPRQVITFISESVYAFEDSEFAITDYRRGFPTPVFEFESLLGLVPKSGTASNLARVMYTVCRCGVAVHLARAILSFCTCCDRA